MNRKKRVLTFLLTFALMVGSLSASVFAEPSSMTEAGAGSEEIASVLRRGGLRQQEYHEVAPEDMPELYQAEENTLRKRSAIYRSDWDKYSTNYYYNQLSEAEQIFWDNLDAMCLSYLTGTENAVRQGSGKYSTKSVAYSNLNTTQVSRVMLWLRYSNPQYYFLDLGVYGYAKLFSGEAALGILPAFADGTRRMQETTKMKNVIDSWMAQINAETELLEKERVAHDLICKKVIYDPGYEDPRIPQNEYNQVAYSVFCTDSTVCAGYSQAMQLLMNGAGIDCAIVTSAEHEWNIIRLNNYWYCVDCTWDDNIADYWGVDSVYRYFNRSEGSSVWSDVQHKPESLWNGYLPTFLYDSGASDTEIGRIQEPPEVALSSPQIFCPGSKVTLASSSGGTIYYTTDGSDPAIAFCKARKYTGEFPLYGTTTVRAIAVADGRKDSPIASLTIEPRYTIVFHANGGYIGSPSVGSVVRSNLLYYTDLGRLEDVKRKGYAFFGWYTDPIAGVKIDESTKVTADTTYYAQWAKVNPKKAAISSVKNQSKKSMFIKIKKMDTATGYQIRYSLKKSMAGAKKKETTDTSYTVKKLKKGRTYYVQVRMYQRESVSGKKKYGAWSKVKSVKIKK